MLPQLICYICQPNLTAWDWARHKLPYFRISKKRVCTHVRIHVHTQAAKDDADNVIELKGTRARTHARALARTHAFTHARARAHSHLYTCSYSDGGDVEEGYPRQGPGARVRACVQACVKPCIWTRVH